MMLRSMRTARAACPLRSPHELARQQKVCHPDHAVHRRAQFVAHGGEEERLGAVRILRLLQRLGEALFSFLAVGDVAADGLDLDQLAVVVADREFFPGDPADAPRGQRALVVADTVRRHRETGEARQHARALAFGKLGDEGMADDLGAVAAERVAEDVVHIGEAALQVLAQDEVALRADEIAVASSRSASCHFSSRSVSRRASRSAMRER